MIRITTAIVLLISGITSALAQGTVTRIGPITPGDCASFSSPNTIQDGGFPCPGAGGTLVLPNGTTATTQSPGDNTAKVATDQFVQTAISSGTGLPAGIDQNILNTQTANYTVANTDCGKIIQAGTGSTGFFTITLPATAGFPVTCTVSFLDGDTTREKGLAGFPANFAGGIWPLQAGQVKIVNGAWVASIVPGKWKPTSAVVFNVATTGTDAFGCALGTGAAACATGQFAMNLMCTNIDPRLLPPTPSPQMTIQYADGAYTSANIIGSFCDPGPIPWVGSTQNGWLKIAGNTNLTGVTLACGANVCFSPVHSTAGWWIEGFSTTGTSNSVVGDAGTHLYLGINKYGTTGGSATDVNAAYGSLVEFETNFTTTGSKSRFVTANQSGSRIIFKPVTVTLSSSTFTVMYQPAVNATITAQGSNVTYSGTATVGAGNCYQASVGGGLQTDGGLAALTTACGGSGGTLTNPGWAD